MPDVVELGKRAADDESTPESLRNRISLGDMGTRVVNDGPEIKPGRTPKNESFNELLRFVFKYLSDLPDSVVYAAAQSIGTIMQDQTLNDESRHAEVQEILNVQGSSVTIDFGELDSITQGLPDGAFSEDLAIEEDALTDNSSLDFDSDEDQAINEASGESDPFATFVPINSAIKVRDLVTLRPQDIDSRWLKSRLESTGTKASLNEVLDAMDRLQGESLESWLTQALGLQHLGLVRQLAHNALVVLWYTRLAQTETGTERERILDRINALDISIESCARREQQQMEVDEPTEVDLRVVGRPIIVATKNTVRLPEGSTRFTAPGYEQYNLPPLPPYHPDWDLKPASDLPSWAQRAFTDVEMLNAVQSKVSDVVVGSDTNVLVCAPTGAGKTNIALMAITRALHAGVQAVYIAPLKALVQEQLRTFQDRLQDTVVAELSGDQSQSYGDLRYTELLVATPEKWDVVTRKAENVDLLRNIGLIIIDEIHLLHDESRGGVIENIVVRHSRLSSPPRLIGLSATLPNYEDVAAFLRVPPQGLFYFGPRFRPVPLEQQYVGVTVNKPIHQLKAINDVCVEKVTDALKQKRQVLVFVHSRKDTKNTRDILLTSDPTGSMLKDSEVSIHHAGLSRDERESVELSFKKGLVRVIVCTATLAWGVNLPAAVVILKGTEYYDPSSQGWTQLSPQDVLQMLGRAGRPGFDSSGLGIILTTHKHLSYFASIGTLSMPIQSRLVSRLPDSLNAEISLRTVRDLDEAVDFINHTFWAVRSKKDPIAYGEASPVDIAHSALRSLSRLGAVSYDHGQVIPTFLGAVASSFYVSPESVATFARQLKPWLSEIDIVRVFCRSAEFSTLPVRSEEFGEIRRLSEIVPIPIRDDIKSSYAKVNVLLQAYISRLELQGFALGSDMFYVARSASRLFRAIYELSLGLKWSNLAKRSLNLYLMVDRRQWYAAQSPFRQFDGAPVELIRQAEKVRLPWRRYFELDKSDIGDALRLKDSHLAITALRYMALFPRYAISTVARPRTTTVLNLTIETEPLFDFDPTVHRNSESLLLMVEDQNGRILSWESLSMGSLAHHRTSNISVSITESTPFLYVRLISERWLHGQSEVPVDMRSTLFPSSSIGMSDLPQEDASDLDTPPTIISERSRPLGPIERTLIPLLLGTNRSAYIGLPPGASSTASAELAAEQALQAGKRVLVIVPSTMEVEELECAWGRFWDVTSVLTDTDSRVVLAEVNELERLTRKNRDLQRALQNLACIVCIALHKIGENDGALYELALTRIIRNIPEHPRIVGLGYAVASARSIGQWIGAQKADVVNFTLSASSDAVAIDVKHWHGSFTLALRDLAIDTTKFSTLLIVRSREHCSLLATELAYAGFEDVPLLLPSTPGSASNLTLKRYEESHLAIVTVDVMLKLSPDLHADQIALFGTKDFTGANNLSMTVVLDIISRASKEAHIFTDIQWYYAQFVTEPIPLESKLTSLLADAFIPDILTGGITGPQEAVNWLSSTFLYRRLRQNPSYYGSENLQEWVSELVESTFERLASVGAVELDHDTLDVTPLPLAHISSRNGVLLRDLQESRALHPAKVVDLPQSTGVSASSLRIVDTRLDIAVARGNLQALLEAVDQRQALVQAVPLGVSPLYQIPFIGNEAVIRCHNAGIVSVQDFVAIEDDSLRQEILGFGDDDDRMLKVANFVNHFPIVDIVEAKGDSSQGSVMVVIDRDIEPEDKIAVISMGEETDLREEWYLVIGDASTGNVLGFEKTELSEPSTHVRVRTSVVPGETPQGLTAWLLCGDYMDADKEIAISW